MSCVCWSPEGDELCLLVTRKRCVVFGGHQEEMSCVCWPPGDELFLLVTRRRCVVFVGHQEEMSCVCLVTRRR